MATLLVTHKMSAALAERVETAVRGHPGTRRTGRLKSLLRLLTGVFVVASVIGVVHFRTQRAARLEAERADVLSALAKEASQLTPSDRELPARVTAAVALHATAHYAGDQLAKDLHDARRLSEALAEPTLYLRGPLEGLTQAARVPELAAGSSKDAFVLCLLAPPEARTEKALRLKASAAYAQGPSMQATSSVERVAPLLQALPLLGRDWRKRIEAAETHEHLRQLAELVSAAPLHAAVHAAKARQLLLVLDETAGVAHGAAELDGERAHAIRVVLTDLTNGAVKLRFRRDVDPSWLSDNVRAQYASGIDSCTLAMDLLKTAPTLPESE